MTIDARKMEANDINHTNENDGIHVVLPYGAVRRSTPPLSPPSQHPGISSVPMTATSVLLVSNNKKDDTDDDNNNHHASSSTSWSWSCSYYYYYTLMTSLFHQVQLGFLSLRGSPPELWKAYVLKFLDSYSYFSFSIIFTLWLSHDFGYSDIEAGTIYGAWGALITIYGLLIGMIIDKLGVAKSLKVGFAIALIARIGIFMTTSKTIVLFHIGFTLPLGNCLGIPVLTTGIRRYTNESSRGFAFGLFYVVMNVAALISGPIVDMLTIWYKGGEGEGQGQGEVQHQQEEEQTPNDNNTLDASSSKGVDNDSMDEVQWSLTSYRAIILTGIVANAIACLVTLTVREIKLDDGKTTQPSTATPTTPGGGGGDVEDDENKDGLFVVGGGNGPLAGEVHPSLTPPRSSPSVTVFRPTASTYSQIFLETIKSPSFRRFLLVCLVTLNVRMIFRHLDATLPKYMVREFGDNVPKGTIYSINPALIIILVPLVTAATTHVDPLLMIHHGSYISAASVFFLAFSTSIWACIVFVTLLSIGEAIWSPRLYDYTMSVCREGREGTYMALSSAPLFLAKLPVGFLSGYLLERYCPEEGERHSKQMWLIIGLLTASSPILLTVCWGYVSKRGDEEDEPKYTELSTLNTTTDTATTSKSRNKIDDDDES